MHNNKNKNEDTSLNYPKNNVDESFQNMRQYLNIEASIKSAQLLIIYFRIPFLLQIQTFCNCLFVGVEKRSSDYTVTKEH